MRNRKVKMDDASEEMTSNQQVISSELHHLFYRWNRLVKMNQAKYGFDLEGPVNGRILGLVHFSKKDVYQKDIERAVGLTKSAISNLLTDMMKKGYIRRLQVEGDARLRKIVLTPEGEELHSKLETALLKTDECFTRGLTEDDQEELIRLLTIIENNMKEMENEVK